MAGAAMARRTRATCSTSGAGWWWARRAPAADGTSTRLGRARGTPAWPAGGSGASCRRRRRQLAKMEGTPEIPLASTPEIRSFGQRRRRRRRRGRGCRRAWWRRRGPSAAAGTSPRRRRPSGLSSGGLPSRTHTQRRPRIPVRAFHVRSASLASAAHGAPRGPLEPQVRRGDGGRAAGVEPAVGRAAAGRRGLRAQRLVALHAQPGDVGGADAEPRAALRRGRRAARAARHAGAGACRQVAARRAPREAQRQLSEAPRAACRRPRRGGRDRERNAPLRPPRTHRRRLWPSARGRGRFYSQRATDERIDRAVLPSATEAEGGGRLTSDPPRALSLARSGSLISEPYLRLSDSLSHTLPFGTVLTTHSLRARTTGVLRYEY